jgi:membrane protein
MTTTHGPGSARSPKRDASPHRRTKPRTTPAMTGASPLPTASAATAQDLPEGVTTEGATRLGPFHPVWTYGVTLFNKFNNDTTMNLVAMVSFNVLTSIVPLILALITAVAVLPVVSNNVPEITAQINTILPADLRGNANVGHMLTSLHSAGKLLTLVSIVGLLWGGMNLFSAIECAFAFIFKVKTRDLLPQKLMSLVMILLFVVLLPLSFVATIVVGAATTALGRILPSNLSGPSTAALGLATALGALFVLFVAIYTIVPNRPIPWSAVWRGAVFSSLAMAIVNTAFPIYTAHFVGTREYSTAAIATAIITITWFWFFSLVLLLGAQINALSLGIGPWKYDLTRTLMEYAAAAEATRPAAAARRHRRLSLLFSGIARDSYKVRPPGSGQEAAYEEGAGKPPTSRQLH